jgi:hypothetical protein
MIPNWLLFKTPITTVDQFPENTFGFIYKITHIDTNKAYIGKKSLYHNKKHKLTKKQLAEQPVTRGRKSTHEVIQSESDWKTYYGSSKELIADVKQFGQSKFLREIIYLAKSKKHLTYLELKAQFQYDVLEINSYNDNILGKFFRKDLQS